MEQRYEDNTVGSLSEVQQSIIMGCLLGDGSMRKKKNAYLEINHCFHQKALVDWKYQYLQEFVRTPPKARTGNGDRIAYRFSTRSLPILNRFYDLFYIQGKKQIPRSLSLDPLILAVWFMDDGSKSRTAVYLNTQQFPLGEQRILIQALNQLGIQSAVNRDKTYFRLRIKVGSMDKFRQLVWPHIIPQFFYKLPLGPVSTDPEA